MQKILILLFAFSFIHQKVKGSKETENLHGKWITPDTSPIVTFKTGSFRASNEMQQEKINKLLASAKPWVRNPNLFQTPMRFVSAEESYASKEGDIKEKALKKGEENHHWKFFYDLKKGLFTLNMV